MTQWRSKERVYHLDANGEPYSLRYAVGDLIDEEEARRQGLIPSEQPEPAAEGKRIPGPPADKARRTANSKTTTHPPKE